MGWSDPHRPELNLGAGFVNPATFSPSASANAVYSTAVAVIANTVAQAFAANCTLAGLYSGPTAPTTNVGGVTVYQATDNAAVTISSFSSGEIANTPVVGFPFQRVWLVCNGNQAFETGPNFRPLPGSLTPTANTYTLWECVNGATWTQTH